MTKKRTSPGIANLLCESHWAIPREKGLEMRYEFMNRNTPCAVCCHSFFEVAQGTETSIRQCCTENLSPKNGCPSFKLDKDRVCVDYDNKEETK